MLTAFTFTLEDRSSPAKTYSSRLSWTSDATLVVLQSADQVRVFSLVDTTIKRQISNGSAGLGSIAASQVIGQHVFVAWEFGTVQQWHLGTARCVNTAQVKLDRAGRPLWALRPGHNTDIFAVISQTKGQVVLTLTLPPRSQTEQPFTLTSTDARALQWSTDGHWLAVLDSPLARHAVHVYTPDGHLFRSIPSLQHALIATPSSLGFTTLKWSSTRLALASPHQPTAILDTRSLSLVGTLDATSTSSLTGWRESIASDSTPSYQYITGPSIPDKAIADHAIDMDFNANGSMLAAQSSDTPSSITIWNLESRQPFSILILESPIKKMCWHPSDNHIIMLRCVDGALRIWDTSADSGPIHVPCPLPAVKDTSRINAQWVNCPLSSQTAGRNAILVTDNKAGWILVWPNGRPVRKDIPDTSEDTRQQSFCHLSTGVVDASTVRDDTLALPPLHDSIGSSEMF